MIGELGRDQRSMPATPRQWVAFAFCLALETAMRKGEILSLAWSDIDFEARQAHLLSTKNGDARFVLLSRAAMALLRIAEFGIGKAPVVPIATMYSDHLLGKARKAVGPLHIHFYDLQREAATTMAPKLSSVFEPAASTENKSFAMLQIYNRPRAADLAARLDG